MPGGRSMASDRVASRSRRPLMEAAYLEAVSRGSARRAAGPTASAAWCDTTRRLLLVVLEDGVALGVPLDRLAAVRDLPDRVLRRVRVAPSGALLLWDRPDVDVAVEELLAHALSGPDWMRELARAAGKRRSDRKAAASRANGAKGGRPRTKS